MHDDLRQARELEAILAVAEKIGKRTHRRFVIDDKKRADFIRLSNEIAERAQRSDASDLKMQILEAQTA